MPSPPSLQLSANQPPTLTTDIHDLLSRTRYSLVLSNAGLARQYKFRTFGRAMMFINRVADKCKDEKHHPDWKNSYNKVDMLWTTHQPRGISERDVKMAWFCEDVAAELGAVEEED